LTHHDPYDDDNISPNHADAMINSLMFDRHEEETAVETLAPALKQATEDFFADPLGKPLIPNWARVSSALPGFLGALSEAVETDNTEYAAKRAVSFASSRS